MNRLYAPKLSISTGDPDSGGFAIDLLRRKVRGDDDYGGHGEANQGPKGRREHGINTPVRRVLRGTAAARNHGSPHCNNLTPVQTEAAINR
jgi:hypothetical protein